MKPLETAWPMYFSNDIDEESSDSTVPTPVNMDVDGKFLARFGGSEPFPKLLEDRVVDFYGESRASS